MAVVNESDTKKSKEESYTKRVVSVLVALLWENKAHLPFSVVCRCERDAMGRMGSHSKERLGGVNKRKKERAVSRVLQQMAGKLGKSFTRTTQDRAPSSTKIYDAFTWCWEKGSFLLALSPTHLAIRILSYICTCMHMATYLTLQGHHCSVGNGNLQIGYHQSGKALCCYATLLG